MQTVYHARSLIDAQLVKDALEGAGIPAFIAGHYLTGGIGQLPACDLLAVQVPASAWPAARALIRDIDARERAAAAADAPAPGLPVGRPA